jgi:signal peptidase I
MNDVWIGLLGCLLIVLCTILLVTGCIFVWYSFIIVRVENTSMEPTLRDGERVLVFRLWPDRWLHKGQVVIIVPLLHNQPGSRLNRTVPPGRRPFIKRIVGIKGDVITATIADLEQMRQRNDLSKYEDGAQRTWHIPPNHVFVVGDNHPIGIDSLTWGPIPAWNVLGIALVKLPFGSLRKSKTMTTSYFAPPDESTTE